MPIIGFEDVPGQMFAALEEAGHGSRIIIADRSLDTDRRKQLVVDYRGRTSDRALHDTLRLIRRESPVTLMMPDPNDVSEFGSLALRSFQEVAHQLSEDPEVDFRVDDIRGLPRLSEDAPDGTGFYDLIHNSGLIERQIVVRTPDPRPYACATFIVGHSQFGE